MDNEFKKLIQRVKKGNNNFERYRISDVGAREVRDIKNLLGIDVSGYTHNINSDGIRHILKRHGENGEHDNTMSITDDIARIGWVIENYDTVELIIEDGKQSHSKGFADKNNNPAPQIKYSKKINGTYYVVEAAFENRYNKLWVQSAYLGKNREDVTQVPDAAVKPPEVTARTDLPSPSSKISLSQDRKNVNKDYSKEQAISQGGVASFASDGAKIKTTPRISEKDGIRTIGAEKNINDNAFIDGLWDGAENTPKNSVEKSQLESVENLSDDDIIRMAKEYLRSPEGQKDKRPYLRHRPSYVKNQIETVYENGKNIFGKVYDPSGPQVQWDRSKPRKGQWDMGHLPGQKYSVVHAKYVLEMMTPTEFKNWHDDPKNYRPELPSTNRGHKYE